EEESGATQVVSPGEDYDDEPNTQPGLVGPGRMVTPVEVPRAPIIDEQPVQRPSLSRLSPGIAAPPRPPPVLASNGGGTESTTVSRQARNTMDGIPRVVRPEPSEVPPPRASLTSMPAIRAPAPPPVAPPPPEDRTDELQLTLPPAAAAARPAGSSKTPPAASARQVDAGAAPPSNRLPLLAGLGAVGLLVVVLGGYLLLRPAPMGYLMVDLPSGAQGKARVSFNGRDLKVPPQGPVLEQVAVGPAMVMVSAEGYKTFTQSVDIAEGTQPTRLEPELERDVRTAQLLIVTQPSDAVLMVDNKVVRSKGSASYMGEVPADKELTVEASAQGYRTERKNVRLRAGSTPSEVQFQLELESFEVDVQSTPPGATILAGGKELGQTPTKLRLPSGVKQVSLKLRCHDEVDVRVAPGTQRVNERLKKQRGCR
ncbi:MAG: PEGA domain-containing protein, partial [Cystobacter sp.]